MPRLAIQELLEQYRRAESVDHDLFQEMKTNLRLYANEHYTKKQRQARDVINNNPQLTTAVKLRLSENHINRIVNYHVAAVNGLVGSVSPSPKNPTDHDDKKNAELCGAVWRDMKQRKRLKKFKRRLNHDFHLFGEMCAVVKWNPQAGKFLGQVPVFDTEGGEIRTVNQFAGDVGFERVLPFDLLRAPQAQSHDDVEWYCIRKMAIKDHLKERYKGDPERLKMIENDGASTTFQVFNGTNLEYQERDNLVLVMEFHYKPSPVYPRGYFYIAVEGGILHEGEYPLGGDDYPIIHTGYDEIATSPRFSSFIRHIKGSQREVNRSLSQTAQTQVTFGPTIFVQRGSSLTPGGYSGAHKVTKYSGQIPQREAGQSGMEYFPTIDRSVKAMYQIANLEDVVAEKQTFQQDTYAELMRHIKDKKKFSYHAEDLEEAYQDIVEKGLIIARAYYPDDMLVPAIGKNEAVNMAEFRTTKPLHYLIKPDMQSDDLEEKMGKVLTFQHLLQYADLSKEDMGKLLVNYPYGNHEDTFAHLTMNHRASENLILALDRGEQVQVFPYDDASSMLKALSSRIHEPSFGFLHPQIKQNYQVVMQDYQNIEAKRSRETQNANLGVIPTGPEFMKVDNYVLDGTGKRSRQLVPKVSFEWFMQRLVEQGVVTNDLEDQNAQVQRDIAIQAAQPQPQGRVQ